MALLDYQQEMALFHLQHPLTKNSADTDYFELIDIYRQLETEGYLHIVTTSSEAEEIIVTKTEKGRAHHYNWVQAEFR